MYKSSKKWISFFVIAVMMAGMGIGWMSISAVGKELKEIRFICMAAPSGRKYAEVFKEFEKYYGIKVIVDQVPWLTYVEKASLAMGADESPYDVINANVEWVLPAWVAGGKVIPLNEYIEKSNYSLKDFSRVTLANVYWPETQKYKPTGVFWDWDNSLLYGIPSLPDTTPLCFRKDWFREAGIPGPPKTWEEFLVAAQKLTQDRNGDGIIDQWGYAYGSVPQTAQLTDYWSLFLHSWGADFLNKEFKPAFNNEIGIEATQFMIDLYRKYKVVPPGTPTYGIPEAFDVYKKGLTAMCTQWGNALISVEDPSASVAAGKTGYALTPVKERIAARFAQWAYIIPKGAKDPELSWKFIEWASSSEVMEKLLPEVPSARMSMSEYVNANFPSSYLVPLGEIISRTDAAVKPQIPNILEVDAAVAYPIHDAILGKKSIKEALKEAEERTDEVMRKAGFYK